MNYHNPDFDTYLWQCQSSGGSIIFIDKRIGGQINPHHLVKIGGSPISTGVLLSELLWTRFWFYVIYDKIEWLLLYKK